LLAARRLAATTVSATIRAAHLAGIALLATGGIGGVHRRAIGDDPPDVSADIDELAATPVAVVCSGPKAILDLPATLELLESRRVPVVGLAIDELPAFYATTSGLRLEHSVVDASAAAATIAAHLAISGNGGLLIVQPPPPEVAIAAEELEGWVGAALIEAAEQGLRGGGVTPFVLDRIRSASGGRSLKANLALIVNNARLAARIATALASA
jgi:pseudouridine-5'-phosphate glycosidase